MPVTYRHGNTRVSVQLECQPDGAFRATLQSDGVEHIRDGNLQSLGSGSFLLVLGSRRWVVYTASEADRRFVWVNGEVFALQLQDEQMARGSRRHSARDEPIEAPMPGQVRQIMVAVGESVERGQTLMLLEAMKMELRIAAPHAGVIQRLNVAQGDVVQRGQTLAEILSDTEERRT